MVTCDSWDDIHKSVIYLDRILVLLSQRKEELEDREELRILTWLKIQIVCYSAIFAPPTALTDLCR